MQGYLLDEAQAVAHQSVELRAVGQRREGTDQTGACIAVEVPLACEACPSGEDGEGYDLAGTQGRSGTHLVRGAVPFAHGTGRSRRP
jgi:hypothetical protein